MNTKNEITMRSMTDEEMKEWRKQKEEYEKRLEEQLFKFHMNNPDEQAWLNGVD